MTVKHLSVDDVIRVATCGGGLKLNCQSFFVGDLIRIATVAKSKNAVLTLENSAALTVDDMLRLATAGSGVVIFE